ncbi:type VI secretion system lipoprotein TssJ [Noviherbaspirillum cavernae]|uniref:Type VI secretion system lipoprotein TssJ n=1 Tax=Noviherbaspirillum cavernae TaxID=2320862 RepID=A0A418X110_9BURK|nr:type VI secretion system lipoprotein TssJ [Noviherbaspirillum cavernae]RJG06142.1 type VI secretion system lipoprotein TssJ [Noviherbaspirillum cavernae]
MIFSKQLVLFWSGRRRQQAGANFVSHGQLFFRTFAISRPWGALPELSVFTLLLLALAGCGVAPIATGKVAEIALQAVGIALSDSAKAPRGPKYVQIRLKGADDMNAGEDGKGLSAIVRLYKLKDQNSFQAMPYTTFGRAEKERLALGDDLVEVKELILSPGQTLELKEKVENDTAYLGVVTLFRSPNARRWRFSFAASEETQKTGITLGIHACAMSATSSAPIGMALTESSLLSPVKCSQA